MVCRLCLKTNIPLQNVFSSNLKCGELTLIESVTCVFGIEIDVNDSFSKLICLRCENVIQYVGSFRTLYRRNQLILEERQISRNEDNIVLNQPPNQRSVTVVPCEIAISQNGARSEKERLRRLEFLKYYYEIPTTAVRDLIRAKYLETSNDVQKKNKPLLRVKQMVEVEVCKYCSKIFKSKRRLNLHHNAIHKSEGIKGKLKRILRFKKNQTGEQFHEVGHRNNLLLDTKEFPNLNFANELQMQDSATGNTNEEDDELNHMPKLERVEEHCRAENIVKNNDDSRQGGSARDQYNWQRLRDFYIERCSVSDGLRKNNKATVNENEIGERHEVEIKKYMSSVFLRLNQIKTVRNKMTFKQMTATEQKRVTRSRTTVERSYPKITNNTNPIEQKRITRSCAVKRSIQKTENEMSPVLKAVKLPQNENLQIKQENTEHVEDGPPELYENLNMMHECTEYVEDGPPELQEYLNIKQENPEYVEDRPPELYENLRQENTENAVDRSPELYNSTLNIKQEYIEHVENKPYITRQIKKRKRRSNNVSYYRKRKPIKQKVKMNRNNNETMNEYKKLFNIKNMEIVVPRIDPVLTGMNCNLTNKAAEIQKHFNCEERAPDLGLPQESFPGFSNTFTESESGMEIDEVEEISDEPPELELQVFDFPSTAQKVVQSKEKYVTEKIIRNNNRDSAPIDDSWDSRSVNGVKRPYFSQTLPSSSQTKNGIQRERKPLGVTESDSFRDWLKKISNSSCNEQKPNENSSHFHNNIRNRRCNIVPKIKENIRENTAMRIPNAEIDMQYFTKDMKREALDMT